MTIGQSSKNNVFCVPFSCFKVPIAKANQMLVVFIIISGKIMKQLDHRTITIFTHSVS